MFANLRLCSFRFLPVFLFLGNPPEAGVHISLAPGKRARYCAVSEHLKEGTTMAEQRIISADSHFVEPPTMWAERIDARFRDRAPHTEQGYKGRPGEWFRCENIQPVQ